MNKKSAGILLLAIGIPILLACIVGFNTQLQDESNAFKYGPCGPLSTSSTKSAEFCERGQASNESAEASISNRISISQFLLLATAATGVTLISLGRKEDATKDEGPQA